LVIFRRTPPIDITAKLRDGTLAEKRIDNKGLKEALGDGSIALLSCRWLLSRQAESKLTDHRGRMVLRRRQELPKEAFLTNEEAVALLEKRRRSILVLSHGWLTRAHPDPHGTTLRSVFRFLRGESVEDCGLFMDFVSLPQLPRSTQENELFQRGLHCMGYLYASVLGTTVLQLHVIEPSPSPSESDAWNDRPYNNGHGKSGRGWCVFESSVSNFAHDHFALQYAGVPRAKVYELKSNLGRWTPRLPRRRLSIHKQLQKAKTAVDRAEFTGNADRTQVETMLAEFAWTIRAALDELEEMQEEQEMWRSMCSLNCFSRSHDPQNLSSVGIEMSESGLCRWCERELSLYEQNWGNQTCDICWDARKARAATGGGGKAVPPRLAPRRRASLWEVSTGPLQVAWAAYQSASPLHHMVRNPPPTATATV